MDITHQIILSTTIITIYIYAGWYGIAYHGYRKIPTTWWLPIDVLYLYRETREVMLYNLFSICEWAHGANQFQNLYIYIWKERTERSIKLYFNNNNSIISLHFQSEKKSGWSIASTYVLRRDEWMWWRFLKIFFFSYYNHFHLFQSFISLDKIMISCVISTTIFTSNICAGSEPFKIRSIHTSCADVWTHPGV